MEVFEVECVKSEPVWENLSEYSPPEDLYADHKVKQELVIGPELLQQVQQVALPVIEITVKIENGETSEEDPRNCNCKDTGVITALPSVGIDNVKHNLSQKDLFKVQNCFVKIQRMILHKEQQYICKTCGKTFSRRSICTYHMRRHLKIKTARKELSNEATNVTKQAKIHVNKNKTSLKNCDINKPYKCEVCRKQFRIKSQLINHERTHTGEKPYSCRICSRAFSELSNLRKHERLHTGERPFSCKICKRRFAIKCNLLDHIRTHTKERPYSCNFCFNQFRDFTNFRRHKLIHTKDKQFTCDICNHQFTRKYRLVKHIHNHSTKRNYACEICSKQFEKKCSLKAHEKQHKENYLCEICDKQFSQIFALKRHLLSHMAVPALG